jgi:autotransporter-associated beta strand protein
MNVTTAFGISQLAGSGTVDTLYDSLYYNTPASSTFSGSIIGNQGLEVDQGTLVLTGSDSFTGGTLVAGGTLILTTGEGLAAGTTLIVGDPQSFSSPLVPLGGSAIAPVPEPGTLWLAGVAAGIVAIYLCGRHRSMRARRHLTVKFVNERPHRAISL